MGEEPPKGDKPFSSTLSERIYCEVFNRTNGLIIERAVVSWILDVMCIVSFFPGSLFSTAFKGTPVDTLNSPDREEFPVIMLGYANQTPTEEQKKVVGDLLGLDVESIITVFPVDA